MEGIVAQDVFTYESYDFGRQFW